MFDTWNLPTFSRVDGISPWILVVNSTKLFEGSYNHKALRFVRVTISLIVIFTVTGNPFPRAKKYDGIVENFIVFFGFFFFFFFRLCGWLLAIYSFPFS